jgi:hypothetical protein
MRLKLARTAVGLAATIVVGTAQPALAAPALTARVQCSPAALAAAITSATSNETLQLTASCRYVLTTPLPAVSENLTIEGNGASLVRSTAAGTPGFAILTATSGNLAINRLSFSNGSGGAINYQSGPAAGGDIAVTRGTFAGNAGGAINDDGSPDGAVTVTGATFIGNTGGAINDGDEFNSAGPLTVTGAAFTRNTGGGITDFGNNAGDDVVARSTFTGNAGGGINYNSSESFAASTLKVTGSAFTGNTGSGISCASAFLCLMSVTGSTFTGNTGGGITTGATAADDELTVSRSTFIRNSSDRGGAIDLDSDSSGSLIATSDVFAGNTASVGGGAIYNFDFVAATNSTFTGNTAPVGGGMENEWNAEVTGSAFRRNTAQSDGGGLYNDDQISVTGSTFDSNAAASGGGIFQIPIDEGNFGQGTPTISLAGTAISGNRATADGGGIVNTIALGPPFPGPGPGTVTVTDSPVRRNFAGGQGGGIFNFGGGTVPLASSAVTLNSPDNCAPANSVPGCDGAVAPLQLSAGLRAGPAQQLNCVVHRLDQPGQLRDPRPQWCGVHDRAAGEHLQN